MKILGLEFSSEQRSVAVVAASPAGGSPTVRASVTDTGARSVKAVALIESALREARVTKEEIECLAVGLGPGSYTGIRIAIALAQGWQLARGVKLLGLSSADSAAAAAREAGLRGRAHLAIDAQRGEVYVAVYQISDTGWTELSPLCLATMAELQALAESGDVVIGPEVNRWCAAGRVVFPSAQHLALMAAGRADFVPGEKLEPIYLRPVSFVKAPPPRVV
ncbi:MAG: tRNA (adenosine(37)-N6)-threonylcarbamoyltransferase complex dimerization subunit type 1 TsaB [Verrucomicrobia bacterium]|nr:tRNA (adenosine(37)-N6)-threonylcarbamoyltransferase complex dimerization subunit type 1 TsaB [Verrucomicrobiota bacterium]